MASTTAVLVPLKEYLATSYRPDRDWIDGEVRERALGEQAHARVQVFLAFIFRLHQQEWGCRALTEQRVQVSENRFRIPDVCLVPLVADLVPILRTPPVLCIEILSREDRMSDIQERVEEYLAMGVSTVWVVDPARRKAYTAVNVGSLLAVPEILGVEGTDILVPLAEVFAELDQIAAGQ